jgi:transcriptional regulator with XRE-family HTH domain
MPHLTTTMRRVWRGQAQTAKQLIELLMTKYGKRDAHIAAELGVNAQTVYRWRHGQNTPHVSHVEALQRWVTRLEDAGPNPGVSLGQLKTA